MHTNNLQFYLCIFSYLFLTNLKGINLDLQIL